MPSPSRDSTCPSLASFATAMSRNAAGVVRRSEGVTVAVALLRVGGKVVLADHLPEVLLLHEPLRLHALEDLAPSLAALLLRRDLVQGERRGRRAALRLEQRRGDLLVPDRELVERSGRGRGRLLRVDDRPGRESECDDPDDARRDANTLHRVTSYFPFWVTVGSRSTLCSVCAMISPAVARSRKIHPCFTDTRMRVVRAARRSSSMSTARSPACATKCRPSGAASSVWTLMSMRLSADSVARRMSSDDIVNVRYATESSVYDVPVPPATPAPAPNADNPTAAHP